MFYLIRFWMVLILKLSFICIPVLVPSTSWTQRWVDTPSLGDQEPAIACLIVKGKLSPFRLHYFGIVPQYGSWNGIWERVRPSGFSNDDGVGFMTQNEIEIVYHKST